MYGSVPAKSVKKAAIQHVDESAYRAYSYGLSLPAKAIGLITIFAVLFITGIIKYSEYVDRHYENFGQIEESLLLAASNDYGSTDLGSISYPFLVDALLVEPYRDNLINVTNRQDGCVYAWAFAGPYSATISDLEYTTGSSGDGMITLSPVNVGRYIIQVNETCGESIGRYGEATVWVKYIRRELTTLSDADRDEFLDAFYTLWSINTIEGQQLYGDKYKSLYYFATLHNDGGSNSVCDEFHGGLGFINNHMYLSLYLEQSLQLVNPRTALHYMEYSQYFSSDAFTSHLKNQLDGGAWTEILSSKFFGTNDPVTGEILDGRWAGLVLPTVDSQFFIDHGINETETFFPEEDEQWLVRTPAHLASPYGLLRSPWNFNPSEYTSSYYDVSEALPVRADQCIYPGLGLDVLTRFNNVHLLNVTEVDKGILSYYAGVNCDQIETFVTENSGKPLVNYLLTAEDDVHGIVHFTFGGAGGNYSNVQAAKLQANYGLDNDDLIVVTQSMQTFVKTVFPFAYNQSEFVTAYGVPYPLSCSGNPWDAASQTLSTTAQPGESGGPFCSCSDYYLQDAEHLDDLINFMFGDFMDSSAPQYKLIELLDAMDFTTQTGAMQVICSMMAFDGDMAGSGAATDPLFWAVHGSVERLMQRAVIEGVLSDTTYSDEEYPQICSGHKSTSTKAWLAGFSFLDETVEAQGLTNSELSDILNPTSDEYRDYINYVYDSMTYPWCEDSDSWFSSS